MNRNRLNQHKRLAAGAFVVRLTLLGLVSAGLTWPMKAAERQNGRDSVTVSSPDEKIRVAFELKHLGDEMSVATYRVSYRDQPLVNNSRLGLDFADTGPFGSELRIVEVTKSTRDETYRLAVGKSSTARDHYRQVVIVLEEQAELQRRIELTMRAYNDGIALRYRIPEQSALDEFVIADEHTQFSLPRDCMAYALPLQDYTTPYEAYYKVAPLAELKTEQLFGQPLLLKHPGGVWIAVAEANLTDYAAMFLSQLPEESGANGDTSVLAARLSPLPGQPNVKVKGTAPHSSPWRVLMIADNPAQLIESNLIVNLNQPCAIADTSWIKPGKVLFPWWNGYVVKHRDFESGLNTATMKHYIDFCAESGIESFSLDGFRDQAWYGGRIQPADSDKLEDITTSIPEIDLPEVLRHAKQQGVLLRIWMHWKPLKPQMDHAFAVYEEWGIKGVMVDFLDRTDQEMVNFYHEIFEKAAQHHLTVSLHGSYPPTGLRRTWPNVLTREGVLNLEYNKFDSSRGSTPEHELQVPFARMLAGPLDYHQGGFRHVTEAGFKPQWIAPLVMGTRARTLANYVVFENHLPMVCDYPAAYRGETGLEFIVNVPTTWDETRVLSAAVGDHLAIARRSGSDWYVGSMTDGAARELTLPLRFLPAGSFAADIYHDDLDAPDSPENAIRETRIVAATDTITAKLAPAGGHVIHLKKGSEKAPG